MIRMHLRIDFVSDIACPWCAVGLGALETALGRLDGITAELHFQPFELNPHMGPEGQDVGEHLSEKYGSTPEQQAQMRALIRQRGAEVGFTFKPEGRSRVWNTFDAHRLLHWAGEQSPAQQHALKKALLAAFFTHDRCTASHEVLVEVAASVGLDAQRAQAILGSDAYTAEVRAQQQYYLRAGINSVPAVIINEQHLISGGQPAEVFERALRQIAANAANETMNA